MRMFYKSLLKRANGLSDTIREVSGEVRLDGAGLFTFQGDTVPVHLAGKFYLQFYVPASASLVATATLGEVKGFDNPAGDYVVSVENNDPVNPGRFIVQIEGLYKSLVVAGAGCTCKVHFVGYMCAV